MDCPPPLLPLLLPDRCCDVFSWQNAKDKNRSRKGNEIFPFPPKQMLSPATARLFYLMVNPIHVLEGSFNSLGIGNSIKL